jgi:hypothetical protein
MSVNIAARQNEMENPRATGAGETGVSHRRYVSPQGRLDDWLDDALAATFPASDPVASPPSATAPVESDRPMPNQLLAGAPPRGRSRR